MRYDLDAAPTVPITMVGDIPLPVEPPFVAPTEGPPPVPVPPIPHIGNPVPYIVHGAEATWTDVSTWVVDRFHSITDFFAGGFTIGWDEIRSFVNVGLNLEQTAWASFISTLESWINASVAMLEVTIGELTIFTVGEFLQMWLGLVHGIDGTIGLVLGEVYGIDQALVRQWWSTVQAIDNAEANLRTWAIDNIYTPLLQDIWGVAANIEATVWGDAVALERAIANIDTKDIPGILARLGVIAGAITALQSWVDDCGEPMCEQLGPKTDLSKLLKALNIGGLLALLTAVSTLTEAELEQLATTIVNIGEAPAETFVNLFVTEGDTLATAIADTLPAIAL